VETLFFNIFLLISDGPKNNFTTNLNPGSKQVVIQNLNPSLSLGHKTYDPRLKARGLRPEPKTEPN